jgi:hypothetical protein
VHIVPGVKAELDERHSASHIHLNPAAVKSAPLFECDKELHPKLEQAAQQHFLAGNRDL